MQQISNSINNSKLYQTTNDTLNDKNLDCTSMRKFKPHTEIRKLLDNYLQYFELEFREMIKNELLEKCIDKNKLFIKKINEYEYARKVVDYINIKTSLPMKIIPYSGSYKMYLDPDYMVYVLKELKEKIKHRKNNYMP